MGGKIARDVEVGVERVLKWCYCAGDVLVVMMKPAEVKSSTEWIRRGMRLMRTKRRRTGGRSDRADKKDVNEREMKKK